LNTYETQLAINEQTVQNKFNVTNPFLFKNWCSWNNNQNS